MRFAVATFLATATVASAEIRLGSPSATSEVGQRILSKARKLDSGAYDEYQQNLQYYSSVRDQTYDRYYGNGQQRNQNWYGNGDENDEDPQQYSGGGDYNNAWGNSGQFDTSWMTDYSLKFDGCAKDYNSNQDGQVKMELLAKFKLCPNSSGKRCRNGGEYVIPMEDYVTSFEGIISSDANCQAQRSTCQAECQTEYNAENDGQENEDGNGRWLTNQGYQYYYQKYQQQKQEEQEEYQQQQYDQYRRNYDQNQGQQQQYGQNVDYSIYNGGNYAVSSRNGEYDSNNANSNNDGYEYNRKDYDEDQEENNYYNRNYRYADDMENGEYMEGYNNYYVDSSCVSECMASVNMAYCEGNSQGNGASGYNDINIAGLVQCRQLDYYDSESNPLYVGATCRNGGVYLDTFRDSSCSRSAPSSSYQDAVGYSLPDQNLVSNDLIPCDGTLTSTYQGTSGICEFIYQDAGKCESKMKDGAKNTGACDYISRLGGGSMGSAWLRYGIGLVLAAGLLIAAYIGYTKSNQGETISVQAFVEKGQALMQSAPSILKQPLAPPADDGDAGTVVSSDSTQYEGPKLETEAAPKKEDDGKASDV